MSGAAGLVDDCTLPTRNVGCNTARTAAITTGIAAAAQPASTAHTATFSMVTGEHDGGIEPKTSSGGRPDAATAASTRDAVGGTTGRPSVHPSS